MKTNMRSIESKIYKFALILKKIISFTSYFIRQGLNRKSWAEAKETKKAGYLYKLEGEVRKRESQAKTIRMLDSKTIRKKIKKTFREI